MLFYRLGIKKLIRRLKLQNPNQVARCKRPGCNGPCAQIEEVEPNIYVSMILSVLGFVLFLTMPFTMLENPIDCFEKNSSLYVWAKWAEGYSNAFDGVLRKFLISASKQFMD